MLVHSRLSMSATWPHDRANSEQWRSYDDKQGIEASSSLNESHNELSGADESSEQFSPINMPGNPSADSLAVPRFAMRKQTLGEDDTAPSPHAQEPLVTGRPVFSHEATPSISISTETRRSISAQSDDGEIADYDDRCMEGECLMAEDDEEGSEDPGHSESALLEKTPAERWQDKRKMKRFRCAVIVARTRMAILIIKQVNTQSDPLSHERIRPPSTSRRRTARAAIP